MGCRGGQSRGGVGKLQIESPYAFSGYITAAPGGRLQRPVGRWLDTGDLAALDADGSLTLHGRADERINRGGLLVQRERG